MKLKFIFPALVAITIFAGCTKPDAATTPNPPPPENTPTHAQPKLRTMKIYIGAEVVDAELALSDEEIHVGMMFRTNIQETDAMFFNLRYPQQAAFWMKNCPESISVAYITSDGTIQEIHHLEQNETNSVFSARNDIVFALETKEGWFSRHHIPPGTVMQTEKGSLADTFLRGR